MWENWSWHLGDKSESHTSQPFLFTNFVLNFSKLFSQVFLCIVRLPCMCSCSLVLLDNLGLCMHTTVWVCSEIFYACSSAVGLSSQRLSAWVWGWYTQLSVYPSPDMSRKQHRVTDAGLIQNTNFSIHHFWYMAFTFLPHENPIYMLFLWHSPIHHFHFFTDSILPIMHFAWI